jgi:hypothetical protein
MSLEDLWRGIETTWGLLTADEVLKILKLPKDEPRLLDQLRATGKILAVKRGSTIAFPGFQFRAEAGLVEPVIVDLVELAQDVGWSQEDLVIWLCSPSGYFGGDRPVEHLDDADELLEKARNEATVEW